MDITNDSDPDVLSKPKFNSTVLGPDERPQTPEQTGTAGQPTLKLSPIPRHRMQFMDTSNNPFPEQQFDKTEGSSRSAGSQRKTSETEREEETASALTGPISKSTELEMETEEGVSRIQPKTPKTRTKSDSTGRSYIVNPFDSDNLESLQSTTYSPSLFERCKIDDEEEEEVGKEASTKSFRWSIGQMADLHPVDIDETEPMCPPPDPVEEAQIHGALDRFWTSQKYIMPSPQLKRSVSDSPTSMSSRSPYAKSRRREPLFQHSPLARRFRHHSDSDEQRSVEVQTMFTFPPNLDLIGLLGNCFQYEEGEVALFEANLSLDTLRQKLFADTMSSQVAEAEGESSTPMAVDEESVFDDDDRPAWYHSDDEVTPTKRLSFDDITDPNEEAEISGRFLSLDVSPIKDEDSQKGP